MHEHPSVRRSILLALLTGMAITCSDGAGEKSAFRAARSHADTFSLSQVQAMAGWRNYSSPDQVGVCMNQGGNGGAGPRVTTTRTPLSGTEVSIFSGDNAMDNGTGECGGSAWGANALWEVNVASNPPTTLIQSVQWSSDFTLPAGGNTVYQAIEWDSQQTLVGYVPDCSGAIVINYGMQYDPGDFSPGHWRFFDYGNSRWVDTGITTENRNIADGFKHNLAVNWSISGNPPVATLTRVTIDGIAHDLSSGNTGTAACHTDYHDNSVSMGLQLDNVPFQSYTVKYDNYDMTFSTDASPPPPPSCSTVPTITQPFDGESDVGSAIDLHVTADSCVESMNVYIDGQLVQTIAGNVSPPAGSANNWISGYTEGVSHQLVVVGYATGALDGASPAVNFIWP